MLALWRDAHKTLADFHWRSSEAKPIAGEPGLVVEVSQGVEVDVETKEPSYWFFGETGWRRLSKPEDQTRLINSLIARIEDEEAHSAEVDASIVDLTRRITTLENP